MPARIEQDRLSVMILPFYVGESVRTDPPALKVEVVRLLIK